MRKPLAYPEPDRLMFITSQFPTLNFDKFWVSPPEYFEFKEHTRVLARAARYDERANSSGRPAGARQRRVRDREHVRRPRRVGRSAARCSRRRQAAERRGRRGMSHELWQRAFGGDPSIVGASCRSRAAERSSG